MKFLVLETITTITNNNNGTSHGNNSHCSIENQPLRQDMNISKFFWKVIDPLELLESNVKNSDKIVSDQVENSENKSNMFSDEQIFSNPMTLIPYNRIEINANTSLENAIQTLKNGVSKEFNISSSMDQKDIEIPIVSLHSTWDIRVLLSHKSQSLKFDLPCWLEKPILFDLCKEYERWCMRDATRTNFFNAAALNINKRRKLHSNKIYLYTMLQLLSLKMDMYEMDEFGCIIRIFLALFWKNGAYDLEKKLAKGEVTMETIDPSHLHNVGFTTPYDLNLDYSQFINEKSTILYMNNLPSIVTQSELSRWFNSYNINPLGFWTIRPAINSPLNYSTDKISFTYVPDSDTIAGFAVFQDHEDALKGLTMNGKSLVLRLGNVVVGNTNQNHYSQQKPRFKFIDRVVEVQPSSNIVLSEVNHHLVPFPQTRNKPRPGDWNCKNCGFSNFQKRSTCFRCQISNTRYNNNNNNNEYEQKYHQRAPLNPVAYPYGNHSDIDTNNNNSNKNISMLNGDMTSGMFSQDNKNGNLGNSLGNNNNNNSNQNLFGENNNINNTFFTSGNSNLPVENGIHVAHSSMQLSQPPSSVSPVQSIASLTSYNQRNGMSPAHQMNMQDGIDVPFRPGDWKCVSCSYHNFAKNLNCLRCNDSKTSKA
ncbi:hypothetical protein QEN19_003270 [Hanseniaspora menglaensis]